MTENKFGVITNWCIYENIDGIKKWLNFDEVVDLLNQFQKENEQLKKENNILKASNGEYEDALARLEEENEQLKSTINTLTCDNTKMKKVLNTTKKENEHIKNTIQEAYHNERTHIGKNTLKQLMEQIQ